MSTHQNTDQAVATTAPAANTARARDILARLLTTDTGLDLETQLTLNEALLEVNGAVEWPYPPPNENRVTAPGNAEDALHLAEQARELLATDASETTTTPAQALAAAVASRHLGTLVAAEPESGPSS